jgi:magnesium-transporting ATPase (P-type)
VDTATVLQKLRTETNGLTARETRARLKQRHATVAQDALEMSNICFMGSNVEVGSAMAVVVVTGTLTQGKILLIKHLDVDGNERDGILNFGFLNYSGQRKVMNEQGSTR